MDRTLKILVIIGIAFWAFFMLVQYHPFDIGVNATPHVVDANNGGRCAQYVSTTDEARDMSYADRFRQFMSGCW